MLDYVKRGWGAALDQPFVVVTLFLYRFAWGFILYELVKSIVVPLQYRFPGEVAPERVKLFLAEIQFQVIKTDLVHPYLWLLLGLLLVKMLLTPVLNAAVCYSLQHTGLNYGYRFFKGIKELAKPFFGIYFLQLVLTLAPLYFLIPLFTSALQNAHSYQDLLFNVFPWLAGWLLYSSFIKIALLYVQLAKTCRLSWIKSLSCMLRSLALVLGAALIILCLSLLIGAVVLSTVFIWAGFWTLVLYQVYRFAESFIAVWSITAQHQLLTDRAH